MQPHAGGPTPSSTPVTWARSFAWTLPFVVALSRSSTLPHWSSDLGLLRDAALCSLHLGGGVSTAAVQAASVVPLGSVAFRASLVACLALSAVAGALFELALRLLGTLSPISTSPRASWLAPGLAALAALAATMTPQLQREATVAGSQLVGAGLALWAVVLAERALGDSRVSRRRLVWAGAALGLATGELWAAGLAASLAIAAHAVARQTSATLRASSVMVSRRILGAAAALGALGVALGLLPGLLRAAAAGSALDLGLPGLRLAMPEPRVEALSSLVEAAVSELGLVPAGLAALGLLFALAHPRARGLGAALAAFVLLDLVVMRKTSGDDLGMGSLRVLALGSLGVAHVAGAYYAVSRLMASGVPLAKTAAVLLLAFDATVVTLVLEQAGETADRANQRGAHAWTRAALVDARPDAAILVDTPALAYRLLVAQLVEGRRPDVITVPLRLVERGRMASTLLVRERRIEPFLRSVALRGRADEYALSELARARLLNSELDRGWDANTLSHVSIDGAWLSIEPQPLSRADRKPSVDRSLERLRAPLSAATALGSDARSAKVMGGTIRAHASALLRLGDTPSAMRMIDELAVPGSQALSSGASLDVRFASATAKLHAARRGTTKSGSSVRAEGRPEPKRKR